MRRLGSGVVVVGVAVALGWGWCGRSGTVEQRAGAVRATLGTQTSRGTSVAASSSTIEVRVRALTGAPAAGAMVRVSPRAGRREVAPHTTDASGRAELAVAPGSYRVTAAALGSLPADAIVDVAAGARVEVDLVLGPPAPALRGVVSDASGGPIAGAVVRIATRPGMLIPDLERAVAAVTDASGRFATSVMIGRYELDTRHAEYRGDTRSIDVGPSGADVAILLTPGSAIEGVVVDRKGGDGAPVAGAVVRWSRERASRLIATRGEHGEVTADAEGRFRIAGLAPGRVSLDADTVDGRTGAEAIEVELGVAETQTGIVIAMVELPAIAVRVTRAGGSPAAGATVTATGEGKQASGKTGEDGRARIAIGRGRFEVRADADDALPSATRLVELGDAPVAELELALADGVYVTGRVEPAVAADVDVMPDPIASSDTVARDVIVRAVRTEVDGRFRIGPLAPGAYHVRARAADGRTATQRAAVPASGDVVLSLEERGAIRGRVVDAEGAAVPFAIVLVRASPLREYVVVYDGVDTASARVPCDADGRFAITGRDPGTWELIALDARGAGMYLADGRERHEVEVIAGATTETVLAVESPAGAIRGVVLDEAGGPVADAWVSISDFDPDSMLYGTAPGTAPKLDGDPRERVRKRPKQVHGDSAMRAGDIPAQLTGADGRFAFPGLRRGRYMVSAEARRGGARSDVERLDVERAPMETTIRLHALGTLRGVVRWQGKPVTDFDISAVGNGKATRKNRSFHAPDGRFSLTGLEPATYTVTARSATGRGQADATIAAAGAADVAIELGLDARVIGRIVDAKGAPLRRWVDIFQRLDQPYHRAGGRSSTDGTFDIRVPPGPRQVIVLGEGEFGHDATIDITLAPGQVLDLGNVVPVAQ